jgi:hypothetical protein
MLSTTRPFPAFDVATTFTPDQQTRFFADLGDVRVHRNHVEHIQQAHAIHAKTLKAAQTMLDALAAPAREVRQVIDFAGEETPKALQQIEAQKAKAAQAITAARAELMATRREMQARQTATHWLTEQVLANGAKVTEARSAVALLPASMLPTVLRDAIDAGDTARTAAVLHRLQHDDAVPENVRETGLATFGELLKPVRECLRRIDQAANDVVAFAEHQADTFAEYPTAVDMSRLLRRANQQSVFPALHDGITLDSGPSLLVSANSAVPRPRTTKPQLTTFAAGVESNPDGNDDDLPPAA